METRVGVHREAGVSAVEALCRGLGLSVPPGWQRFFDLASAWGARIDLTAARDETHLAEILFLDAAMLIQSDWLSVGCGWVDVGAGAGAPSIPLALHRTGHRATLVEPRRKRAAFLRSAIGTLDLVDRVSVLEQRVSLEAPALSGAPFEVALSRATFAPDKWRALGSVLASEVWVFTAGSELAEEAGLGLRRRIDYRVPSTSAPRSILAYA